MRGNAEWRMLNAEGSVPRVSASGQRLKVEKSKSPKVETNAGLGEGVDDFQGRRRSATGEVLGVEASDARLQARRRDQCVPRRPLGLDMQSSRKTQDGGTGNDKGKHLQELGEPVPSSRRGQALIRQLSAYGNELARDLPQHHPVRRCVDEVQCRGLPLGFGLVTGVDEDVRVKPGHEVRRVWGTVRSIENPWRRCLLAIVAWRPPDPTPESHQWAGRSGEHVACRAARGPRAVLGRRANRWPPRLLSYLEYSSTRRQPARSVRHGDPGLSKTARTATSGPCSFAPRGRRGGGGDRFHCVYASSNSWRGIPRSLTMALNMYPAEDRGGRGGEWS